MQSKLMQRTAVASLVIPGVAVLIFALFVPIGYSIYYSLTEWSGLGQPNFVGLDNYVTILTQDPVFWTSLGNALILILATVFIQNPLAFLLAAVISKLTERWSQALRTLFFVPAVLSVVVLTALWVNLLNPNYGMVNKFFQVFGITGPAWLSDPATALGSVIWIITWSGFGWALLFYYTGLMTVPKEIIEAASIDGATGLQSYIRVVIPAMLPTISAVIVIDVISCLKQMEIIFLSTQGGPGQMTQFIAVYLYQKAFNSAEYGYGSALSVLFVVIAVGLTILIQRLMKMEGEES